MNHALMNEDNHNENSVIVVRAIITISQRLRVVATMSVRSLFDKSFQPRPWTAFTITGQTGLIMRLDLFLFVCLL